MFDILIEGWRIFNRSIRIRFSGLKKFSGSPDDICKNIVNSCWNGKHFQTTAPHGNYHFYSRDFGMCAEALKDAGHKQKVTMTLEYALDIYSKNNSIYVGITPYGIPFNFPNVYSPDSVAYMFRALRISKDKGIVMKYLKFLNEEIKKFEETVIDKEKGIIKDESFSGMRDHEIITRSCYDMIMACMLSDEIDKINSFMKKNVLDNKLKYYDLKKNLIKYYWNKKGYFQNSVDDNSITSHCNIFPYWLKIINDKKMLKDSLNTIEREGLLEPLPAKYAKGEHKFIWQEIFVPDWETKAVWSWLGMIYINLLSEIDKKEKIKAKKYFDKYSELIAKNGFVELYDEKLLPYRSLFFVADNTMIWASLYLSIAKKVLNA